MSVDNFDGDGFADQPSIIYAFDGGDEIRELSRSGYGELGPSPGDVIKRESTKSDPTNRLPELPLPGSDGLNREDCGEDIPAFACSDRGNSVSVGRTCGSPTCEWCCASAVKRRTGRVSGKAGTITKLLANNLSQSAAQDKLSAKERRSTKRGRCLDNSCFCTKRHKRLPSGSLCSISHGRDWSKINSLSDVSVYHTNRIHHNTD